MGSRKVIYNRLLLAIILILIFIVFYPTIIIDNTITTQNISSQTYNVVRVVDGDTIVINYHEHNEKIRLLMIDTPESVHPNKSKNTIMGAVASNYTKLLLKNERVSLKFDKDKYDRYDRILAYVYCDGIFINELLVRKGYAEVEVYEPNHKYKDMLFKAENKAKEEKIGIWY